MQEEIISIIVPIYNVEKYLDRCINSLLSQSYKNLEIILVDDGSPDNCPQMCDEYLLKDSRIKVIHKKNEGLGYARNSGLSVATGKYISFVDSDDYVSNDMCEKLILSAEKYNADIVYGGIVYENTETNEKTNSRPFDEIQVWRAEQVEDFFWGMIGCEPREKKDTIMEVSVWKALFKRSIFCNNDIKFVSEREFISEDVIFNIDFIPKCDCIVAIPDCIYYYCVNPNSLSKVFRTDRFEKVLSLYREMERRIENITSYTKVKYDLSMGRFLLARARTNTKQIVRHKSILSREEVNKGIRMICESKEVIKVLETYPISKLPVKYFLVAYFMKKRLYMFLKILFAI